MKKKSILFIANSFADDTIQYMPEIARDFDYDIDLFNLYIGGCDINTHIKNLLENNKVYELRIYDKEKQEWVTEYNVSSKEFIRKRHWDYIVLQQSSYMSGLKDGLKNADKLLELVQSLLKDNTTKFVWNMTWSYPYYSDLEIFSEAFNKDQNKMYQAIVNNVKQDILTNSNFVKIIPNGTAIMKARKYVKDELLFRDGFHLSYQPGRYLAGLTAVATLLEVDISKVIYKADKITGELQKVFVNSVKEALKAPLGE